MPRKPARTSRPRRPSWQEHPACIPLTADFGSLPCYECRLGCLSLVEKDGLLFWEPSSPDVYRVVLQPCLERLDDLALRLVALSQALRRYFVVSRVDVGAPVDLSRHDFHSVLVAPGERLYSGANVITECPGVPSGHAVCFPSPPEEAGVVHWSDGSGHFGVLLLSCPFVLRVMHPEGAGLIPA